MDQGLSDEAWRRFRQEARREAAEARGQEADRWAHEALDAADLALLLRTEQRLAAFSETWAIHERPLLTRVPLVGPLLAWLGARVVRFLLQNQVAFDAEVARALQELYRVQKLLAEEQVERTDDLFTRLDESLLSLEARLRDLEEEVDRLRQQR